MNRLYHTIDRCRICGNTELAAVLDLGMQCLTGLFPHASSPNPDSGPLELVKCHGAAGVCGLLQLRHQYDGPTMYGMDYGYRSSLNRSMVNHLRAKVQRLIERAAPGKGDFVVDIGSNDGTSLSFFPKDGPTLIGIDPTIAKFVKYYQPHIRPVAEFFSAAAFRKAAGSDAAKAKVVMSVAMFYDLERPIQFMQEVHDVLADDGIWHLEQSYMPDMLEANAYDTVCHEHVEYYGLKQIAWMAGRIGLRIVEVERNDVNGASFAITITKARGVSGHVPEVEKLLAEEESKGLSTLEPYARFAERTARHRDELRATVAKLRKEGRRVFGLGASTKGNVILQYCGFGPRDLDFIGEVNEDKLGCVTPGSRIPIISEKEAHEMRPDVFMVLPWHFREHFLRSEEAFIKGGGRLLFPLPRIKLAPE